MAKTSIGIGILLILLGLGYYFAIAWGYIEATGKFYTSLIPAIIGGILVLLGLLALNDRWRKLAMHVAVLVGMLGLFGGAYRVIKKFLSSNQLDAFATATVALCAVFVALCVRSFIEARRSRTAKDDQPAKAPNSH